ncbi:MAG: hypothetical protein ACI9U2_003044, partial [Bradymonadia bacterium]
MMASVAPRVLDKPMDDMMNYTPASTVFGYGRVLPFALAAGLMSVGSGCDGPGSGADPRPMIDASVTRDAGIEDSGAFADMSGDADVSDMTPIEADMGPMSDDPYVNAGVFERIPPARCADPVQPVEDLPGDFEPWAFDASPGQLVFAGDANQNGR